MPGDKKEEKKLVTIKIDGREVTVEAGTPVIDAAEKIGIYIPRFCYHPALSAAANCRMCLVETNQSRKPVPACREPARDGLEVTTNSDRIKEARRGVLEFILADHPVDCPICDKAGECMLQDQFVQFGLQPYKLEVKKVHKPKIKILGPTIIYDAERCINCTRCVRFMDEIVKDPVLTQVHRGDHAYIDLFPGKTLDNPYSLNLVDICPVGALTSRDFRFKARVWFLEGHNTTCAECSRGCSIRVDTLDGEIKRIVPRTNHQVNGYFMCDFGRLAYHRYEKDRVHDVSGPGGTTVRSIMENLGKAIKVLIKQDIAPSVILSPFMTNEDAFVAVSLLSEAGITKFAIGGRAKGFEDDILIRADKNPNTTGLKKVLEYFDITPMDMDELLEDATSLIVFGSLHEAADKIAQKVDNIALSIVFSDLQTAFTEGATYLFPIGSPYEIEGTWTNEFGLTQYVNPAVQPKGQTKPMWWWVQEIVGEFMDVQKFNNVEDITKHLIEQGVIDNIAKENNNATINVEVRA